MGEIFQTNKTKGADFLIQPDPVLGKAENSMANSIEKRHEPAVWVHALIKRSILGPERKLIV